MYCRELHSLNVWNAKLMMLSLYESHLVTKSIASIRNENSERKKNPSEKLATNTQHNQMGTSCFYCWRHIKWKRKRIKCFVAPISVYIEWRTNEIWKQKEEEKKITCQSQRFVKLYYGKFIESTRINDWCARRLSLRKWIHTVANELSSLSNIKPSSKWPSKLTVFVRLIDFQFYFHSLHFRKHTHIQTKGLSNEAK